MKPRKLVFPAALLVSGALHLLLLSSGVPVKASPHAVQPQSREFRLVNAVVLKPPKPPAPSKQASPKPLVRPKAQSQPKKTASPRKAAAIVSKKKPTPKKVEPSPTEAASQVRHQLRRSESSPSVVPATQSDHASRYLPFYRVDTPPKFLHRAKLRYPVQARRMNVEGTVVVEADIDTGGAIADLRIIRSSGFGFDQAALAYIRNSTFSPAYAGGKPVAVRMRFVVKFTLR